MANALYAKFKQKLLEGSIDMTANNIKAVLVDTAAYAVDLAVDEFLSSIPVGDRIATSANLASKTVTGGVFDAADIVFTAVSGDESEAIVLYKDSGAAATSPLICYIDTATGLAVTPNGADINVAWSDGASKIFAL
jgi:hypothetical protein